MIKVIKKTNLCFKQNFVSNTTQVREITIEKAERALLVVQVSACGVIIRIYGNPVTFSNICHGKKFRFRRCIVSEPASEKTMIWTCVGKKLYFRYLRPVKHCDWQRSHNLVVRFNKRHPVRVDLVHSWPGIHSEDRLPAQTRKPRCKLTSDLNILRINFRQK